MTEPGPTGLLRTRSRPDRRHSKHEHVSRGWHMNRKLKRLVGTVVAGTVGAAMLAACGSGSADSGGLTPVTLRYTFVHTGVNAPWTLGVDKDFFKAQGIDLKLEEGKGSATTAQTVANGSDDFGLVDAGTLLTLGSKELSAKAVMSVLAGSPLVILSPAKSPIESPRQLEGKKLAISAGSAPATLLPALYDANQVDGSKVTNVNLQPGPALTSLLGGQVDAFATSALVAAALEAKGLQTHALKYSDFGVRTPGQYLVASNSLLQSKPDLVRRFVKAAQQSYEATIADPSAAAASFAKRYSDYTEGQALAELNLMLPLFKSADSGSQPVGWMSEADAQNALALLKRSGDITTVKPTGAYLTNEYLPQPPK